MPTPTVPNVETISLEEALKRYGTLTRRFGKHARRLDVDFVVALPPGQVAVFNPCPGPHAESKRRKGEYTCNLARAVAQRKAGKIPLICFHRDKMSIFIMRATP